MNNEHKEFLNLRRLPASVNAEEAAILLGIPTASITILAEKLFLRPLGKTLARNAPRRFSSAAIEKLARAPEEMSKMHHIISSYWRARNGARTGRNARTVRSSMN